MNAVPFDTLKMARRLEASGFPRAQAAGAAEAMAEAMAGAELATKAGVLAVKDDVLVLKAELKADLYGVKAELERGLEQLRVDVDHKLERLEHKLERQGSMLEGKLELLRRDMTIRLGAMLIASTSIVLTAIRFLPVHP